MSEPPPKPPAPPQHSLSAQNRLSSSSQDIPAQGRLADVSRASTPALTREGNVRAKFLPKVVPRKTQEYLPINPIKLGIKLFSTNNRATPPAATTGGSLLSERSQRGNVPGAGAGGRGRGRGRGRGELVTAISGPFAAGPAIHESRSRRGINHVEDMRRLKVGLSDHGSSLTVESAPIEGLTPAQGDPVVAVATSTATPTVKKEGETSSSQKPPTPRKKAPPKPRIKKEDENEFDSPDELDGEVEERIDLAELNFPGGPVSSSRKNDRTVRGWKKIELWIEQEDAEQIVIDDPTPPEPRPRQVTVKVEDDSSAGIVVPVPEPMVIEEKEEEETQVVQPRPTRRKKKSFKGKTREEKEEMAREELDLEVLKEQLLAEDGSEREQKLLLLQLPAPLPPLKDRAAPDIKEEIKTEEPSASTAAVPLPTGPPPSGKIGQLRVHASGKTVLSYGGIDFQIRLASDIGFAQDFVAINPYEENGGKAWRLGSVGQGQEGGWLIGVPELKGIGKHHHS